MAAQLFICSRCIDSKVNVITKKYDKKVNYYRENLVCLTCQLQWIICTKHVMKWDIDSDYQSIKTQIKRHFSRSHPILNSKLQHDLSKSYNTEYNLNSQEDSTNLPHSSQSLMLPLPSILKNSSSFLHHRPDTHHVPKNIMIKTSNIQQQYSDHIDNNSQQQSINPTDTNALSNSTMPPNSIRYFLNEIKGICEGSGHLIGNAFHQMKDGSINTNLDEVRFHMMLLSLMKDLSSSQQAILVELFRHIQAHPKTFTKTRLPTTISDTSTIYISGKHAIYENIPHPNVFIYKDHACVSLRDIIEHMLAHGVPLGKISPDELQSYTTSPNDNISLNPLFPVKQYRKNKRKRNINNIMIIPITFWSDDFEATHIKSTPSVWIHTVTIFPPLNQNASTRYTHVLSIGRKTQSHEPIIELILEELKKLNKTTKMYCGISKKDIDVQVRLHTIAADRPERSSLNYILSHTGKSTIRWKYSALIDINKLPSCKLCFQKRLKDVFNLMKKTFPNTNDLALCIKCADWNYENKEILKQTLPKNYPSNHHLKSPCPPKYRSSAKDTFYIIPVKMTYEYLKQGIKFCYFNLYHKTWSKSEAECYLRILGVNKDFSDTFVIKNAIDNRDNCIEWNRSCTDNIIYPSLWINNIELDQCIDTPMHQIFQGLIKSSIKLISEWLKVYNCNTSFFNRIENQMICIKDIRLDWCNMEKFTSTGKLTGGWVAENYLAFSRLYTHLYSLIDYLLHIPKKKLLPLICFIQSVFNVVSRLMSTNPISPNEIDAYIKIFLSCSNIISSEKEEPWWFKGNIISLLNYKMQLQKFGHLRNYWEGNRERYIQTVKPILSNIRDTSTYLYRKLNKLSTDMALKEILTQNDISGKWTDGTNRRTNKQVQIYKQFPESCTAAISIILLANSEGCPGTFLLIKSMEFIFAYEIVWSKTGYSKFGIWYSEFNYSKDYIKFNKISIINNIDKNILDYGLLVQDHEKKIIILLLPKIGWLETMKISICYPN